MKNIKTVNKLMLFAGEIWRLVPHENFDL